MRKFHLAVFLLFTLTLLVFRGNVRAQRSSYNSWDRLLFKTNPQLKKRIYNLTEINLGYGARFLDQPYEIRRAGISTLLGFRYNRAVSIGLGVGLEVYNGGSLAPLYLEGQIYMNRLSQGSIKPFLTGASGFLFNVSGIKTDINLFANPGFGLLIPMTYRSSLSVGIGLYTQWNPGIERYSFITTKIGLLFY
jgi:hypothetical protein